MSHVNGLRSAVVSRARFMATTMPQFESKHEEHKREKARQEEEQRQRSKKKLPFGVKSVVLGSAALYIGWNMLEVKDVDDNWMVAFLKALPLRALSAAWGEVNDIELPVWARAPVYKFWTWAFDCKLDEMRDPLESYPNLGQFFIRHLKPGMRPIADSELVSPVDGRISVFGELKDGDRLEQIKGMSYSLKRLLKEDPKLQDPNSKVHYCVLYLAPGDYHRIHSPTDAVFTTRRHFPGEMLSVAPAVLKIIPNLFTLNERVVLSGSWTHGFFSMVPVAAYNVGNIKLEIEPDFTSNLRHQYKATDEHVDLYGPGTGGLFKTYAEDGLAIAKGQEVARFQLGSTVVLVFETKNHDFKFNFKEGDRVKVGQPLGEIVHN